MAWAKPNQLVLAGSGEMEGAVVAASGEKSAGRTLHGAGELLGRRGRADLVVDHAAAPVRSRPSRSMVRTKFWPMGA